MKPSGQEPDGGRRRIPRIFQLLCCFGLIFAVYSNSLQNGFYLDDYTYIVQNTYIQDLHNIPKFFYSAAANSTLEVQAQYRPLFPATFALDYWWTGGMNPAGMHFSQIIFFLLLTLGILQLLRALLALTLGVSDRTEMIALYAALLYGLHPVNSEIVNYLSARSELLSAAGAVWSVVVYLSCPRLRRSGIWILPMLAGAFAKPVALVLPGLWLAGAWLLEGWVAAPKAKARIPIVAGALFAFAIAAGALFFLRHLDGPLQHYGQRPMPIYLRQQCWSWLYYLRLFFWPTNLSASYPQIYFTSWLDWHFVAGLMLSAALVAGGTIYAWRRPRSGRLALFGILWYFIALAPSSSIISLSEPIREYRISFPAIGLLIAMTAITADVLDNQPTLRRIAPLLVGVLLIAAGAATYARNRVWRNEIFIYEDVVRKHPDDLRSRLWLGRLYLQSGQNEKGRLLLQEVEKTSTLTPWVCLLLGELYVSEKNLPRAERYYKMALSIPPVSSQAHYAYAHFLDTAGRTPEAIAEFEAGLALAPASHDARIAVMGLYFKMGDYPNYCREGRTLLRLKGQDGDFPSPHCQTAR